MMWMNSMAYGGVIDVVDNDDDDDVPSSGVA